MASEALTYHVDLNPTSDKWVGAYLIPEGDMTWPEMLQKFTEMIEEKERELRSETIPRTRLKVSKLEIEIRILKNVLIELEEKSP